MTGFGKATYEGEGITISVKVQATNAKGLEINTQVPTHLEDQVLVYHRLIKHQLQRGKIDLFIEHVDMQLRMEHVALAIQEPIFNASYQQLVHLAKTVGASPSTETLFQLALQVPGVIASPVALLINAIPSNSLQQVADTVQAALVHCDQARMQEGEVLANSIKKYWATIKEELAYVDALDGERITSVKDKLIGKLNMLTDKQSLDEGRLEQEMVYYLEKLDMQEEKVRLASHLAYFDEIMQRHEPTGKHLAFMAQEMGREINTLGAKANHVLIQQHVTIMKSELEKIKEQLQNLV